MAEQLSNRVSTTLAGSMSSSTPGASETITVASVTGFPTVGNFRLLLEAEVVLATATNVGSDQFTITRGQEGTTAAAHANGTVVTLILTKGALAAYANDTLARIAATAPLTVTIGGGGDPTIALPAAAGAQNGYLSSTLWTKLNGIETAAQVNVLEGVTGTAPIVAAAIASKLQAISISAASGGAAGSMSAAHYTLVNAATDAATASTLAKRDSNGDITFRYVNSTRLLQTTDDNLAANPQRLYGKQAADNYLRTFNAANVTVGAATALAAGADRTKLDSLNTGGSGFDSTGNYAFLGYTLRGKRRWLRSAGVATTAAVFNYVDTDIATPENIAWADLITYGIAVWCRNAYRVVANLQKKGNADSPADTTHWSIIVGAADNVTNLSTITNNIAVTMVIEEL